MAAFGSLQTIFEHPLPESPALLGRTLSTWTQINPTVAIRPIERSSSVTEIFGELHFTESLSSRPIERSSSVTEIFGELHFTESLSSPPSFPKISPLSSAIFEQKRDDNEKVKSTTPKVIHKKSISLNSESLHVCTEGLGFESFDSVKDMKLEWENSKEKIDKASGMIRNKKRKKPPSESKKTNRTRRSNSLAEFPPPITCIGGCGKPWVCLKSYRQDGRFVLKQVRIPTQELLQACREDGRLKLHFIQPKKDESKD